MSQVCFGDICQQNHCTRHTPHCIHLCKMFPLGFNLFLIIPLYSMPMLFKDVLKTDFSFCLLTKANHLKPVVKTYGVSFTMTDSIFGLFN